MKHAILTLMILILLAGCGKKAEDSAVPSPDKSSLLFPLQNAACISGSVLSVTQTAITFNWTASANTESYELSIKNLLSGLIIKQTSVTNQLQVTLLPNTPYSWSVISKSSKTIVTTASDNWKFYISGPGVVSHPPYPADALKPSFGQSVPAGTINLSWTGADPDNDIDNYDVYFSASTTTPSIYKVNVKDLFVNNVAVTSGTTYYWRVITKDAQGNISDSGVYQFKVN